MLASSGKTQHKRAGVSGFEPELSVLETDGLTVNTIPLGCDVGTGGQGGRARRCLFRPAPLSPCRRIATWSPYEPYAYGKNDRTILTPNAASFSSGFRW